VFKSPIVDKPEEKPIIIDKSAKTSSKFYNKYKNLLYKYRVVELFKYDIIMYDDCVNGPKRTNKVNHITFDFTERGVVNVS
jgi:hypothetical protein